MFHFYSAAFYKVIIRLAGGQLHFVCDDEIVFTGFTDEGEVYSALLKLAEDQRDALCQHGSD